MPASPWQASPIESNPRNKKRFPTTNFGNNRVAGMTTLDVFGGEDELAVDEVALDGLAIHGFALNDQA